MGVEPADRRLLAAPHPPTSAYRAARCLREVTAAWHLVYRVYAGAGLIEPNPYLIHTTPQAANERSAVFLGRRRGSVESTLTAVLDSPAGLPLDAAFHEPLEQLRYDARRLMECCLFAHEHHTEAHWQPPPRAVEPAWTAHPTRAYQAGTALVNLMRLAFWYGVNHSVTDFALAVPAHHAQFFAKAFGFAQLGAERPHPLLGGQPLVLLVANLEASLRQRPLPFALNYSLHRPISPEAFEHRVRLKPHTIAVLAGHIDGFLRHRFPGWELAA
jgi:hypothetical protein